MRNFLLMVFVFASGVSFAERRILVLPPANIGKVGDEASEVIQRSLGWVLEEAVDDVLVVSPDEMKPLIKKFPDASKDLNQALKMARKLDASLVVLGSYRIRGGEEEGIITAKMAMYSAETGRKIFERKFRGPAGIELFDTIDNIALGLAEKLAGRKLYFASIVVSVSGSDKTYKVYLNGRKVSEVSLSSPLTRKVIANKDYELILRNELDKEVFRKVFRLKPGENKEFKYSPSGSMKIEVSGVEKGKKVFVFVNGEKKGTPPLVLKNIPANVEYVVEIKDPSGKIIASGKQFLDEGEMTVVKLQSGAGLPRKIYAVVSSLGNAYGWLGARYYITYNVFVGLSLGATVSKQTELKNENVLVGVASVDVGYVFVGNLRRDLNVYSALNMSVFRSFDYKVSSYYVGVKLGVESPFFVNFVSPFAEVLGRLSTDNNEVSFSLLAGLRI